MLLALSVGNTNIFGGLFCRDSIEMRFRHATTTNYTSDQFGLFLRSFLRENEIDYKKVQKIAVCSVVPRIDYPLRAALIKYFAMEPFFLHQGVDSGLIIDCQGEELGADRVANAIAATHFYPGKDVIVVSLGTATTICVIKSDRTYLSGAIMPGFRIAMEALQDKTAKLPSVEIVKPESAIGKTTIGNIQSGLYYGQLGAIRELIARVQEEAFLGKKPIVIGTGGFVNLFSESNIFDVIDSDLILHGIRIATEK